MARLNWFKEESVKDLGILVMIHDFQQNCKAYEIYAVIEWKNKEDEKERGIYIYREREIGFLEEECAWLGRGLVEDFFIYKSQVEVELGWAGSGRKIREGGRRNYHEINMDWGGESGFAVSKLRLILSIILRSFPIFSNNKMSLYFNENIGVF